MTKGLETLVRLREMELDSLRREMAEYYREAEGIDEKNAEIARQLVDEQVYMTRMEGMATYAMFAQSAREWQAQLEEDKRVVDAKIQSKMAQVTEAFEALKTVQIALDKSNDKKQRKAAKAEQDALDEAAITRYARGL